MNLSLEDLQLIRTALTIHLSSALPALALHGVSEASLDGIRGKLMLLRGRISEHLLLESKKQASANQPKLKRAR